MAIKQDNTTKWELPITEGTKAELVVAGKLKPEWFPGSKGKNKNAVTIEGDELRSVVLDKTVEKLRISRCEEGVGIFDVDVIYSEEERERREQIERKHFKEMAYKEASALAKDWIDGLPDSVDRFKRHSAWRIEQMMDIHFSWVSRMGGYSFDKKTVQSFNNTVGVLCDILMKGDVKFEQFTQDEARRRLVNDAFNRGICLGLTGYERDVLIRRFMSELSAPVMKATEAVHA